MCLGKYRPSREITEEERLPHCLLIIIKYSVIVPGPGVQSAKQLDPAMPQRERRQEAQAVGSPGEAGRQGGLLPLSLWASSLQAETLSPPCGAKISLRGVRLGISLLPETSLPVH